MQDYTKKMLRDIKLSHYNKADNELSMIGPPLISGRNIGAYGRKVQELYTTAIVNMVKDIFECEKKALSRLTAFPRTRYFSTLKKDVLDIANREIHLLGEKLKNRLQPLIISPNTKYSSPSALLDRLQNSTHDQINRAADQLQEEIRFQLPKKVAFWLGIASLPIIEYLTGWVRSFLCVAMKNWLTYLINVLYSWLG